MDFENYTDLMDAFLGEKIIEIGPGIFTIPYISLLEKRKDVDYAILDAVERLEDAIEKYTQVGGALDFVEEIKEQGYKIPEVYIMPAHKINEIGKNFDSSLFVKSLEKMRLSIFYPYTNGEKKFYNELKQDIEEYLKDMGIYQKICNNLNNYILRYTYEIMVLDRALEKSNNALIIPINDESYKHLTKMLNFFEANYVDGNVKEPVWIIKGEKIKHWSKIKTNKYINVRGKLNKEKIAKYIEIL